MRNFKDMSQTRPYDPRAGEWAQPDPAGYAAGQTNVYVYCANSPTNFVDPNGLAWWEYWPFSYGASLGTRIANGLGPAVRDRNAIDSAEQQRRKNALVNAMEHGGLSVEEYERAQAALRARELQSAGRTAVGVADGCAAAAELGLDTLMIIEGGLRVRGAVAPSATPAEPIVPGFRPDGSYVRPDGTIQPPPTIVTLPKDVPPFNPRIPRFPRPGGDHFPPPPPRTPTWPPPPSPN